MYKNSMSMMKCIGAGITAGAIIGFLGCQALNNDKKMRKRTNRTLNSMGELVDNVQHMFK